MTLALENGGTQNTEGATNVFPLSNGNHGDINEIICCSHHVQVQVQLLDCVAAHSLIMWAEWNDRKDQCTLA